MKIFWESFFSFLEKIGLLIIPLFAVYLGWKLRNKTYIKQLLLTNLRQKFDALRKIKSVIQYIAPDLNKEEFISRLKADPQFCKKLMNRTVRLLGLRNELIPFLDSKFIDLIDKRLNPLCIFENEGAIFRKEKVEDFANFAEEARLLTAFIEEKLTEEYKNQLK